jgi:hypothetical protein
MLSRVGNFVFEIGNGNLKNENPKTGLILVLANSEPFV